MNNLLIVDKDEDLRKDVSRFFRRSGYVMDEARDFKTAVSLLEASIFDVIISDTAMPGGSVFDLMNFGMSRDSNALLIISAQRSSIDSAVKAVRAGAFDFIKKPYSIPEIQIKVEKAIQHKRLVQETDSLRGERNIIYRAENFIGESPEIKDIFEIIKKISRSDSAVLLTGETGTGKELIAGAIHYNSSRAGGAFVKVNCAALSPELLERELFGHERGAFPGADKLRIGRFEQADGGTIFLDEICELDHSIQEKILGVLRDKEFSRCGGSKRVHADMRIISATNKDLVHEIGEGRFRADLFYRLNMVTMNIPPLRQRRGDIILLTYFFQKKSASELKKRINEIHPLAIKQLTEYSWPGNIQELKNTIERAVLHAEGDVITQEDLQLPTSMTGLKWDYDSIKIPSGGIKLEEIEKNLVLQALKMCDWVKKDSAKLLGVSERVLSHKIQRFMITHPRWNSSVS